VLLEGMRLEKAHKYTTGRGKKEAGKRREKMLAKPL
jgi:uncharacterized C2H2 Zn-finger protein